MQRFIRSGAGWRVGWDPEASEFKGLVGTDSWAVELTEGELHDFCRLLSQLSDIMNQMAAETLDEEKYDKVGICLFCFVNVGNISKI